MSLKQLIILNTSFITALLIGIGTLTIWEMTREVPPRALKTQPKYGEITWPKEDKLAGKEYSDNFDGIDISVFQGRIFWEELSNATHKPKFIFVRALGKDAKRDTAYHHNIDMCRKYRIPVGSYIFFTMALSVERQLHDFLDVVDIPLQDLRPVIDVEDQSITNQNHIHLKDSVMRLAKLLEKEFGAKPIIYSNQRHYKKHLMPEFNNYPLWMAHYSHEPNIPGVRPILWQRSETGHVHGIWTYVDLDSFINGADITALMLPKRK